MQVLYTDITFYLHDHFLYTEQVRFNDNVSINKSSTFVYEADVFHSFNV